jgi:3-oxoacyl-(acyl-carrier-protein) synthase
MYICGAGCISPQHTFQNDTFLTNVKEYHTNRIYCIDPDYTKYFDAPSLRRMSRLVKFGTAAACIALSDAGVKIPEAISTGTGYGLLELSQRFLRDFISSQEGVVSPTAFIQSTHNTISSNIALLTGCHEHNYTFSQKGNSFESTLIDAYFLLKEGKDNVLIGSYEEIGEFNYASLVQNNELRPEPCSNLALFKEKQNGVITGEGSAFFVVAKNATPNTFCLLKDFEIHYKPANVADNLLVFLEKNKLKPTEVDVVISGLNGLEIKDNLLKNINEKIFTRSTILGFKHLCGEYMTASAFGMFVAAQLFRHSNIPAVLVLRDAGRNINRVLLCNSFKHYYSFFIFERC